MTSRIGNCSSCSARFKVPESFSGDRAKCRKCGGIIEIEPAAAPFENPASEQAPEQEPQQVTTEATAFNFASIGARAAATASSAERSAEPSNDPSDESSPESPLVGSAATEPTEPVEPVEPIAQPPPQRPRSQPKPPPKRAAKVVAKSDDKSRGLRAEKRASPPEASGAEKHHEKRHIKIGAAIAVLLVVIGVVYLLITARGADAPEESATPATTTRPGTTKRSAEASLAAPGSGSQDPADESGAATDAEPDAAQEPVPAKFEFVALERSPGTTDEEWDRMQELSATLRDGGKARKLALKELLHYGIKAVPVLVNSLNGLDLSKYSQWVDGAEVSRFIQDDLLAETILIPYHGAFSTDPKEVRHNQVVLKSMVDYWNAQVNDPARWGALLQKYEEKRAIRGTRGGGN